MCNSLGFYSIWLLKKHQDRNGTQVLSCRPLVPVVKNTQCVLAQKTPSQISETPQTQQALKAQGRSATCETVHTKAQPFPPPERSSGM